MYFKCGGCLLEVRKLQNRVLQLPLVPRSEVPSKNRWQTVVSKKSDPRSDPRFTEPEKKRASNSSVSQLT